MLVQDAMTPLEVEVGVAHTLRQAAQLMAARGVGSAIVNDPDGAGPGIITERDILQAFAKGPGAGESRVGEYLTASAVYAEPDWSLDHAAAAMIDGGFRHLVVMRGGSVAGVISVRDIVRAWAGERGLLGRASAGASGEGATAPEDAIVGTA
ncbi:MAG: CBS domain-containing protein [Patulibacter sp.]|nr:CBS domain-containing protein [Patulibacter sp.]